MPGSKKENVYQSWFGIIGTDLLPVKPSTISGTLFRDMISALKRKIEFLISPAALRPHLTKSNPRNQCQGYYHSIPVNKQGHAPIPTHIAIFRGIVSPLAGSAGPG
jgi:hypothetical protein